MKKGLETKLQRKLIRQANLRHDTDMQRHESATMQPHGRITVEWTLEVCSASERVII